MDLPLVDAEGKPASFVVLRKMQKNDVEINQKLKIHLVQAIEIEKRISSHPQDVGGDGLHSIPISISSHKEKG